MSYKLEIRIQSYNTHDVTLSQGNNQMLLQSNRIATVIYELCRWDKLDFISKYVAHEYDADEYETVSLNYEDFCTLYSYLSISKYDFDTHDKEDALIVINAIEEGLNRYYDLFDQGAQVSFIYYKEIF